MPYYRDRDDETIALFAEALQQINVDDLKKLVALLPTTEKT